MNKLLMAGCVAAGLALAGVSWADKDGGPRGGGPGQGHGGGGIQRILDNEELAKQFGLTDEQIKTARESNYEFQKSMVQLRSTTELAQLDVKKLMDQDAPSVEAVFKAIDTAGKAETELHKAEVKHQLDLRAIIGADKMKEIRAKMKEQRRDDDQQGGDHRPPRGGGDRGPE